MSNNQTIENLLQDAISSLESVNDIGPPPSPEDIPPAFLQVAEHIPVVYNALSVARKHIKGRDNTFEGIRPYAEVSKAKATSLQRLFEKVVPSGPDSRVKRYQKAVREFGRGSSVETIMQSIMENAKLVLRADDEMKAETGKELKELNIAWRKVLEIPPSLSDDDFGHSINNYGNGPQNNNTGGGEQYNNNSGGPQIIGGGSYNAK